MASNTQKKCPMIETDKKNEKLQKIALWVSIALYTFLLPQAIIVYRNLEARFGRTAVGEIPLVSVVLIGNIYIIYGYRQNRNFKHILYLVPAAAIAYTIIRLQPNPNKHIHIPEYVLMAWLLYFVLSKEYQGKGIFVLIFLCGSMLGVIDELEQGIHPKRFYGWVDMIINSSSILIGVLTIMGLKTLSATNDTGWRWAKYLKDIKGVLWVMLAGIAGAILMCVRLFQVQAAKSFWEIYPPWLLCWNYLFLGVSIGMLIFQRKKHQLILPDTDNDAVSAASISTTRLWIFPIITILVYMHSLVVFVSLTGLSFR